MAVAWIGNRETQLQHAAEHAAQLLDASKCPVFTLDTDVNGVRAAIMLADRIGAAIDLVDERATHAETALLTDKGAMTIAPGEARRRADMLVLVGDLPAIHDGLIAELASSTPDLSGGKQRALFRVDAAKSRSERSYGKRSITQLNLARGGVNGVLAALRAQLCGRAVASPVSNFAVFADVLKSAAFPVFAFSGASLDALGLEMLQGLVADLNKTRRASTLHLPASERGWGAVLASTWSTGFAPGIGFARGMPEYDPHRYDAARMIAGGEADLLLTVSAAAPGREAKRKDMTLIALTKTDRPVAGAAVTFACGEPGIDHEAVLYTARLGTLAFRAASEPSDRADAAGVLRLIEATLRAEAPV